MAAFPEWWTSSQIQLASNRSRFWERKRFVPSDAWELKQTTGPRFIKKPKPDEVFDSQQYVVLANHWDHEHCQLCMTRISQYPDDESEGFTDGYEWICVPCYKEYVEQDD